MDTKRKLAMVVATVAVALGAGHLMQNGMSVKPGRVAVANTSSKSAATPAAATPAENPTEEPADMVGGDPVTAAMAAEGAPVPAPVETPKTA